MDYINLQTFEKALREAVLNDINKSKINSIFDSFLNTVILHYETNMSVKSTTNVNASKITGLQKELRFQWELYLI